MNDELFDTIINQFTTFQKGAETQLHREIALSDGFTVVLKILDSGKMVIFYSVGGIDPENRLCHFYFANDNSIPTYSRPHQYITIDGAVTKERIYQVILDNSDDSFEWILWNLT